MRSRILAEALSLAAIGSAMMNGDIPERVPERYGHGYRRPKTVLNKRQLKVRKKAKEARKSRKKNRR